MKVLVAAQSGFCFGVRRALDMVRMTLAERGRPVYTFGPLIHNRSAVERLAREGALCVEEIGLFEPGQTVVIRSHGVSPEQERLLRERGVFLVDTTCPLVKKVQLQLSRITSSGQFPMIVGKGDHPEVIGEIGYSGGKALVISSLEEAEALPLPLGGIGVVAQTTFNPEKFHRIVDFLKCRSPLYRIYDTMCPTTRIRQEDSMLVSRMSDGMLIIGSRQSSNTMSLFERVGRQNPRSYLLEGAGALTPEMLAGVAVVGIAAGASTPDEEITGVLEGIKAARSPEPVEIVWRSAK